MNDLCAFTTASVFAIVANVFDVLALLMPDEAAHDGNEETR